MADNPSQSKLPVPKTKFVVRLEHRHDEEEIWWNLRDDLEKEITEGRMTKQGVTHAVLAYLREIFAKHIPDSPSLVKHLELMRQYMLEESMPESVRSYQLAWSPLMGDISTSWRTMSKFICALWDCLDVGGGQIKSAVDDPFGSSLNSGAAKMIKNTASILEQHLSCIGKGG